MDYYYSETHAQRAVNFFADNLRHTKGEWAGRAFILAHHQENDIIRPLFGWLRPDGTRRYRRVYIEEPRKNGKTELAAGVANLLMVYDEEPGAEGYAIASHKDQARLVFDASQIMVGYSPTLQEHFEILKTSTFCPALMASFKPLTGKAEGKHGLNPSFLIGDESHEWPDDRLYTFVRQGMAARRQPLEFIITTAGTRLGFGYELHDEMLKIRDGIIDDPETLVVIYAAEPDDDWTDPKVWAKANPNLGVSVKVDYLKAQCREAKESVRKENDFKRYHLNIWTEQAERWIPMERWQQCRANPESAPDWREMFERLKGRKCFGGLDLSTTTDLTSLVWTFPPDEQWPLWVFLWRFWMPSENVAMKVRRDRVPYDKWVHAGAIMATDGDVVDYDFIGHQIFADAETYQVQGLAYDRWNSQGLVNDLTEEGLPMIQFGQGYASMSSPSKELERLIIGRKLDHGGHPVARWMAANVATQSDPAGNIKPAKDKSTGRIDGIVSAIMGIGIAQTNEVEAPSVYETRNIIAL